MFWQSRTVTSDAARKRRWATQVEDRHGAWGRVLFDGDELLGRLQYGPAAAFPRARVLPAGPPRHDGALVTCAYLAPEDATGTLERLLLEALADLKARGYATVDAFALAPSADPLDAPHHTLLDLVTLERLGFSAVRTRGRVALMRLELRTLDETSEPRLGTVVMSPEPAVPAG